MQIALIVIKQMQANYWCDTNHVSYHLSLQGDVKNQQFSNVNNFRGEIS